MSETLLLPVWLYRTLPILITEFLFIRYLFFVRPTEKKGEKEKWFVMKAYTFLVSLLITAIIFLIDFFLSISLSIIKDNKEEAILIGNFLLFLIALFIANYIIYRISLLTYSKSERGVNKRGKSKNK